VSKTGEPEQTTISQIIRQICEAAARVAMIKYRKLTGNKTVKGQIWFIAECVEAKKCLGKARKILRRAKS
jgi:hypothetical protein